MPDWEGFDDSLRRLVASAESESLEFKRDVPPARELARAITALANANGGKLVLGVDEQQGAVGVRDLGAVLRELEKTVRLLKPAPPLTWEDVTLDGNRLVIVDIAPGHQGPYLTPDGAFIRQGKGGRRVPLTASELAQAFRDLAPGEARERALEKALAEVNKRLTELQEQAADGFEAAERDRHWTAQLPAWTASGGIGAVLGAIVTVVLGG